MSMILTYIGRLDVHVGNSIARPALTLPVADSLGRGMQAGWQIPHEYAEDDPRHHTIKLKNTLNDTVHHAREDIDKIADPRGQVLFETTAEVLVGLITAYEHYEQKAETAWR